MQTILAVLLCSCSVIPVKETPPTAKQLREWADGPCANAGRRAGIDYVRSLDRASAGDPAALAALFRFTDSGWCDGAAAEGHCAILFGLLQRWGDRPFSSVLVVEQKPVRQAVFEAVGSFPGFDPAKFPLTNVAASP